METTNTVGTDDVYHAYMQRMQASFEKAAKAAKVIFTTAQDEPLFDSYLQALPETQRQYHNCNCCRAFVKNFGHLVTIDDEGKLKSLVWHPDDAHEAMYVNATSCMKGFVEKAKVDGVFLSHLPVWGTPQTGVWEHMALTPPSKHVYRPTVKSAYEAMAEKKEDYRTVAYALSQYPLPMLKQALQVLESDALYRTDRVKGPAQWLHDLQERLQAFTGRRKAHVMWKAVGEAPAGFCHPRSSMVGTLLDDLAAGKGFEEVRALFNAKMAPTNYQRAQAAPAAGAVQAAEKLIEKLGLAPALPRRYAKLAELPKLWAPSETKAPAKAAGGVFSHLKVKDAPADLPALNIPATTMTWDKFMRTVLPSVAKMEALVPASSERFAALVTAANPEAPPLLQWDREEARNPVSWYYASGVDAEFKRRVVNAGGQYENVDIRATLLWNDRSDLDLHCVTPSGVHVYFGNKRPGNTTAWLDVDMNISGESLTPVENIRCAAGTAQEGTYQFYVENYTPRNQHGTDFRVELEVNGHVSYFEGHSSPRSNARVVVAKFDYRRGVPGTGLASLKSGKVDSWGVQPGTFKEVTALIASPNQWGDSPAMHAGRHLFFTLAGCKDQAEGRGRGFFTEHLRPELREARSTLEAYAASATIEGAEDADACGIGMTDQSPWNLTLKVTTQSGNSAAYKIDRWD